MLFLYVQAKAKRTVLKVLLLLFSDKEEVLNQSSSLNYAGQAI
jgi:hypothetical protein